MISNTGILYDRLVNKKPETGAKASTTAGEDEFEFIRKVTKRDDVDLEVSIKSIICGRNILTINLKKECSCFDRGKAKRWKLHKTA